VAVKQLNCIADDMLLASLEKEIGILKKVRQRQAATALLTLSDRCCGLLPVAPTEVAVFHMNGLLHPPE